MLRVIYVMDATLRIGSRKTSESIIISDFIHFESYSINFARYAQRVLIGKYFDILPLVVDNTLPGKPQGRNMGRLKNAVIGIGAVGCLVGGFVGRK